ncbi:MAG TPA: D-Ala-D-Ala carboxypeptidase family metallohydrolase [Methylophilaceae bacterium]|nr:D-Ala-D-Ala carboxypeptidase family metallohydrolase [Methylophilaceae bacterium]
MIQLTEHFFLEELCRSDMAVRKGILNIPSPVVVQNLRVLAEGLEKVRTLLGKPIMVSSGYRSATLNSLVGGAMKPPSAHISGFAADFTCWSFGRPEDIVRAIERSDIKFDQVIMEGSWVHISFAPTMRQETMTALFSGGKVTYTRRHS